jgi:hypothetical protein
VIAGIALALAALSVRLTVVIDGGEVQSLPPVMVR